MARDCAETLPNFFSYIRRLESRGLTCSAIIGENGSSDDTRHLIEQGGSGISLLNLSFLSDYRDRLRRMAVGRQSLLQEAARLGAEPDYICITDLDNVMLEPPDVDAVIQTLQRLRTNPGLFAIGATSRPVYYDLLSFQNETYEYSQLFRKLQSAKHNLFSYYRFHRKEIYDQQELITKLQSPVCASSFNGMCFYHGRDYLKGSYRAHNEVFVCEHVTFNLSLGRITGRNMIVSDELILRTPSDHAPVSFVGFWRNRVRERLSSWSPGNRGG